MRSGPDPIDRRKPGDGARFLRVERHDLGPRLYLAGRRVHEYVAGGMLVALAILLWASQHTLPWHARAIVATIGGWLVVKDWNDLVPGRRDTTRWDFGLHRRVHPLRTWRRAAWVPGALGILMALAGIGTALSALAPGWSAGNSLISGLAGPVLTADAGVIKLPLGVLLVAVAVPVARRRRHVWPVAIALLLGVGFLDLLRGPELEEALTMWGIAVLVFVARGTFHVAAPDRRTLRAGLRQAPAIAVLAFGVSLAAVGVASGHTTAHVTPWSAVRQAAAMLVLVPGPLHFTEHFRWLPDAIGVVGVVALSAVVAVLARPLAAPRRRVDATSIGRGLAIVQAEGTDTLSFFKLRRDSQYLFNADHTAFLAYRVEAGVMLVSGDPVGADDALPDLIRQAAALAEHHGLRLAVLGAGRRFGELYAQAGLRAIYLGDEAVLDTAGFSLEGRPIRKVRQSVTRLERAGYRLELVTVGAMSTEAIEELDAISAAWRKGAPERGFSMALDGIGGEHQAETLALIARDADGVARGFLHLVPCYGRPAVSLAAMRRDPQTPNGLMEYMVARGVEALRERGVAEVSLNFATFARWMRDPANRAERILGRLAVRASRRFQIASLYTFNAKFFPRWEPRDIWFEGYFSLPRTALAALWAEGQIPRFPRLPALLGVATAPQASKKLRPSDRDQAVGS